MRHWIFAEPAGPSSTEPIWTIMSDNAVLAQYWDYWCDRMRLVSREHLIDKETCILDWAAVHWATEATLEALLKILNE